jgi:hypothetical protein
MGLHAGRGAMGLAGVLQADRFALHLFRGAHPGAGSGGETSAAAALAAMSRAPPCGTQFHIMRPAAPLPR